MTVLGDLAVFF